jgi:hypothetical protein
LLIYLDQAFTHTAIRNCVVAVPTYFSESQRLALIEAAGCLLSLAQQRKLRQIMALCRCCRAYGAESDL